MPKIKKIFFPVIAVATSSYFSIILGFGIIAGYLFANYCLRKPIEKGKLKMVILSFGKWRLHLHHWLIGSAIILVTSIMNVFSFLPIFFFGALGGIVLEDLHLDKDWYKIIYKE